MKIKKNIKVLRSFIKEEIGRNFKSVITDPYTFEDFQDYDIIIDGTTDGDFFLTVTYKGKKIAPMNRFKTQEEAHHASRMIIDNDRVKRMNS